LELEQVITKVQRVITDPRMRRSALALGAFAFEHPKMTAVIARVRRERLTYLPLTALSELVDAVLRAERAGQPGAIMEMGVALGGSAIALAKAKTTGRPLKLYDTFTMIPPPGEMDDVDVHSRYETIVSGHSVGIAGDTYYGYRQNLLDEVVESFRRFGIDPVENRVQFVEGLYEDTLKVEFPVAVAHVDCDWYDSVLTCLSAVEPHLVPGGRFVVDDYHQWSGCRKAVDDFFADRDSFRFEHHSRLHVVKQQ
jgi:hypothetical protein